MKRALLSIGMCVFLFLLTACDPGSYKYDLSDLTTSVSGIELINYDNPEQESFTSWVPDHTSELLPLDMSSLTSLEKLDDSKTEAFLKEFSKSDILDRYFAFNSPKGICIKLSYDSGNFTLISCDYENESFRGYIGEYTADGEVVSFIGSFSSYSYFTSLVNNYFDLKVNA